MLHSYRINWESGSWVLQTTFGAVNEIFSQTRGLVPSVKIYLTRTGMYNTPHTHAMVLSLWHSFLVRQAIDRYPTAFHWPKPSLLVPSKTLELWNFFLAIYCKGIQYSLILHKALELFLSLYFESLCLINFYLCLVANLNSYPRISIPWFSFISSYILSSCTRLEAIEPLNSEARNNLLISPPPL